MKILVVDVGGSHVKCAATGHKNPVKFKSGPKLTPGPTVGDVVEDLRKALLPDYGVLGGGNAEHLKRLPPQTCRGANCR